MTLKERASQLKTDIPAMFIALKEKDTPLVAKILAAIVVLYALSPIDLIPDFVPILGYFDDLIILPGLIALTVRLIPEEVMDRCRLKSVEAMKANDSKKWVYALPFVMIWILVAILIYKAVF